MKRKLLFIIITLLIAISLITGGYGYWSDSLIIRTNIKVIKKEEVNEENIENEDSEETDNDENIDSCEDENNE